MAEPPRKSDGAKKQRKQRFKVEYSRDYPWIVMSKKSEYHAYCTYCNADFNISHGGHSDVVQHTKTKTHEKNAAMVGKNKSISQFFRSSESEESKKHADKVMTAELLMTQFIIEHNLPLNASDHLTELFPRMFPDSKIAAEFACKRTKTTHLVHEIAEEKISSLRKMMDKTVFSVATDGSSDRGASEQLYPVLVKHYDNELGKIVTSMLSLSACEGASTGENIFALLNSDISNWNMCIGFCSDNANVMTGKNSGVAGFILRENQSVYVSGCTCHLLHLAASKAADKLPVKLDSLLIDVFYYLEKSTKRKKKLQSIQELSGVGGYKILKHCATRWLSLEASVDRLLQQYKALLEFFKSESDDSQKEATKKATAAERKRLKENQPGPGDQPPAKRHKSDVAAENQKDNLHGTKPTSIYMRLQDPQTKLYCLFLKFTLPLFNDLNLALQANKPLIYCVRSKCLDLLTTLLLKFIKPSVIAQAPDILSVDYGDKRNQKHRDELVIGNETMAYLEENRHAMTSDDRTEFFDSVRSYYAAAVRYILDKFPIRDDLLIHAEVADISHRLKAKFKSVKYFTTRFPTMLSTCSSEDSESVLLDRLEAQFLAYQVADLPPDVLKPDLSMDSAWHILRQDPRFELLGHVMLCILVLPHSNAESERVFSVVRKNQTEFRPNASRALLQSVLVTKTDDFARQVPCYKRSYEPYFLKKAKSATYVALEDQSACLNKLSKALHTLDK